jgi:hypothetical protein
VARKPGGFYFILNSFGYNAVNATKNFLTNHMLPFSCMTKILKLALLGSLTLLVLISATRVSFAQSLLFDGDFESGTFQGWTPGGENGGFTTLAAKGTCYSSNDTTAISFNGDPANNYAALLRSNPNGDVGSIATLRSANFAAGNGLLFSALSETSDLNPSTRPVNFVVRILDSKGKPLAELPLQTAVISLKDGCPSSKRDTAFSVHYIDTRQYNGEISVEFSQHTKFSGLGYFTLIDNVVHVEKGNIFVNQTQPIAVAGTSLTSSNILFLDPRDSIDPDNLPTPLEFSWFINDEETIRLYDMPCVNINSDFVLPAGNHVATLYATDGINYSADTLRFVVTSNSTSTVEPATNDSGENETTNKNITLSTPEGELIVNEANLVTDDVTQSDPRQECDIDVSDTLDGAEPGVAGLSIDIDTTSEETFDATFTIGGGPVSVTSNSVQVQSSEEESVMLVTVTIDNPEPTDVLTAASTPVSTLTVSNSGTTSVSISPEIPDSAVSDTDYETVLEAIEFEYTVGDGDTPVTDQRSISYSVTDSAGNTASTSSTITIQE